MTVIKLKNIYKAADAAGHLHTHAKPDEPGMREMQRQAYAHRGEQYLLIKSPPSSDKSRALMFIALDKLHNQGVTQAIVVVPERSIGGSFADEPLTTYGFYWDWAVKPHWNLCNVPGADDVKVAKSKVKAVAEFLAGGDPEFVRGFVTCPYSNDGADKLVAAVNQVPGLYAYRLDQPLTPKARIPLSSSLTPSNSRPMVPSAAAMPSLGSRSRQRQKRAAPRWPRRG